MKSATEYLWFETKERRELINITSEVDGTALDLGPRRRERLVVKVMGE